MLGVIIAIFCSFVVYAHWSIRSKRSSCPKWREIKTETIKVGASKKKLEAFQEAGEIDYIIIGSGLGGLTTASLLCKAGYRVLVLEQHDIAGGSTHTFEEKGFVFDVGVHYVGEALTTWWSPVRRLFDIISDGQLEWCDCDDNYDHAINMKTGLDIPMNKDPNVTYANIEKLYPGSAPALARYRRACKIAKLCGGVFGFLKLLPKPMFKVLSVVLQPLYGWAAERNAKQVMLNCGLTEEVIGVLSYLYGDYGVTPGRAPFMMQALVGTHYEHGAYFPRGGSESIAKTVVASIQRNGGAVMVRAEVKKIMTSSKGSGKFKATGVVCKDVELRARLGVISNAGAYNTFTKLLQPEEAATHLSALKKQDAMEPSIPFVYLFAGLDGDDKELKLPASNYWCCHDWNHDEQWEQFSKAKTYDEVGFLPCCFLSFGSAKDDCYNEINAKNTATLQLLAPVRMEWFDNDKWKNSKVKSRGADYNEMKEEWKERLLPYLYKHFPQTKGRVVFTDVATPLTANYYLNTDSGENYGLSHTVKRFHTKAQHQLHTETDIDQLYLCGQDALSAGVIAVLGSGAITSVYLSRKSLFNLLYEFIFG